ncbi:hypothetical protein Sps_03418 [Shewanella psychrophila]|uniref:Uncharacterized protein n=1 Tax=Shewanella psychrophila TaxID=225848 RepID=A0A1S6HSP8_9GAMM|nr:hypothetical protein [Shewanella psychrophila]AQS38545.1 hypothetical protein Sps_03418 [Shewanella psychrophila]
MATKEKVILLYLSLFISNSAIGSSIFLKNSLEFSNENKKQEMTASYSINGGQWNDIEGLVMSNPNSLSDLITYTRGDRISFKIMTPEQRFMTESMLIPNVKGEQPRLMEITGATQPEAIHIQIDNVFGRMVYKRAFETDSGRQYRVTTCGGAAVVIACAVGNYGELVIQFAGIATVPVFSGSSYIDETYFDQLEKGKQVELLDTKGHYFSGLFYHEVKVWDRKKGEIFDLKAGGIGFGFGQAVSIKFTRW